MRATSAYFAGAATVIAAIAAGLGGGLVLGEIMSPQQPKHRSSEVTRLEQRMSPQPIQALNGAAPTAPGSAATQAATDVAEPARQPTVVPPQPAAATEQVAARERAAPDDSFARVRATVLQYDARRAEHRRKSERRRQWAEKRKQQRQDDDMNEVEASVREATEWRPLFGRDPGIASGRVRLVEPD
ncbi:hypothetical protein [Bradyrhizobium sp.]|uniref:hypothetical protein n=1 Tax=Bradyrhizobium sp. TaxID=376 RepID=UPI001E142AFA|nr:hypothetical protein [Bradyrhizobium sp.]MBI5318617.1 hypothetical protein [Bradyrhizobium sp.]